MKVQEKTAPTMVSALTARTQLGQILKRVRSKRERFLIGRRGEPQAIVLSVDDYLDIVAPAPDWLEQSWKQSQKNGTDKLTMREIDAEIAKVRSGGRRKQAAPKRK